MLAHPPPTDTAAIHHSRHRLIHGVFEPVGPDSYFSRIVIVGPDPVDSYRFLPVTYRASSPSWLQQVRNHKENLESFKIGQLVRARKAEQAKDLLEADEEKYPALLDQFAEWIADFYLEQQDGAEALKILAPLIRKREPRVLCRVSLALTFLKVVYPGQLGYVESQVREIGHARIANALPTGSTPDTVMLMSCLAILDASRGRDEGRGSFPVGGASRDATWFFNGLAWNLDEGNPLTAISFLRFLTWDRDLTTAFHISALGRARATGPLKDDLNRVTPWLFRFGTHPQG
jgi:hypothetical protein